MIRALTREIDGDAVWAVLRPILTEGAAYDLPRAWSAEEALDFWFAPHRELWGHEENGALLGSYFLNPNGFGGGAHIANAGFAVAASARGRGVGRMLGLHALERARTRGFAAMQFNHVISANTAAVALWLSLGFREIGRAPNAFRLPTSELCDQLILFREL